MVPAAKFYNIMLRFEEAISEKTKELGKLADTMYAHSLSIESMYEDRLGPKV